MADPVLDSPPVSFAAPELTFHERAMCRFVALGMTDRQIARSTGRSTKAVFRLVSSAKGKLNVDSRPALAAAWVAAYEIPPCQLCERRGAGG